MSCFIVAYDLIRYGQNYPAVDRAIGDLGEAIKIQLSLFCLQTSLPLEEVYRHVAASMDENDKLFVTETNGYMSSAQGGKFLALDCQ
jgi:hypothetical protein